MIEDIFNIPLVRGQKTQALQLQAILVAAGVPLRRDALGLIMIRDGFSVSPHMAIEEALTLKYIKTISPQSVGEPKGTPPFYVPNGDTNGLSEVNWVGPDVKSLGSKANPYPFIQYLQPGYSMYDFIYTPLFEGMPARMRLPVLVAIFGESWKEEMMSLAFDHDELSVRFNDEWFGPDFDPHREPTEVTNLAMEYHQFYRDYNKAPETMETLLARREQLVSELGELQLTIEGMRK